MNIRLFIKPGCPWCEEAIDWLDMNGISYDTLDVTSDPAARSEMHDLTGQSFAVAGRSGDWVAIWYGGQKAWFEDPAGKNTVPGGGTLVTPKAGLGSIAVYGRAYPEDISVSTLGYTIPAGQVYVAKDLVGADYYDATTFDALGTYNVFTGPTKFYEISFNHRLAFLRAADVDIVH